MKRPLDYIFKPQSIAIIGASRQQLSIGHIILQNLLEGGFTGNVFPVNPHADVIQSLPCYPNINDVPGDIDLAVIVVPKESVLQVVDECVAKGVRGLVVITAGFKEAGRTGAKLEQELAHKVKAGGLRMVGPNCMGVINTATDIRMNASFGQMPTWPGRVAFMSQSGALGVAMLNITQRLGLGLSMFVSMGNKADISGNDLLEYWEDDPHTDVILMYLESFGNPRKFTQLARRISKRKPIIALKTGRAAQSASVTDSTASIIGRLDVATDVLFQQCGVLRAGSAEELFDFALAFGNCPIPLGNRVAVVSNDRGSAAMVVDACVNMGLTITTLSAKTITDLKAALPEEATVRNPVDLVATANPDNYRAALEAVLTDRQVDAVLVIFVPPVIVNPRDIVDAVVDVIPQYDKPVLGVVMTTEDTLRELRERARGSFPIYLFPESATRALAAMVEYHRLQESPDGMIRQFEIDLSIPQAIFKAVRDEGRLVLNSAEALSIISSYGIPTCSFNFAATVNDAVSHAREIGYPVVLKLMARHLLHKSDVGGVIVDIRNDDELTRSYASLMERADRHGIADEVEGVMIQQMVRGGREVIIGMTHDPKFGPLITFGLSGVFIDTLKDIGARVWPLTDIDAIELIESIRSYPILKGTKEEDPIDFVMLEEVLLRVSQLVSDFPDIAELNINPFIAGYKADTSKAVDAKITLASEA
jgi:acetyltransferase